MKNEWPEEKLAQYLNLYAEGWSHGKIAATLGITRSASVGKGHRLGLQPRKAEFFYRPGRTPKPKPVQAAVAPVIPPPPSQAVFGVPVTIIELSPRHCRWPLWGDRDSERFYCGAVTAAEGASYCVVHTKVGTSPPRRIAEMPFMR